MRVLALAVTAAVAALSPVSLAAQSRPDFSGTWTLVSTDTNGSVRPVERLPVNIAPADTPSGSTGVFGATFVAKQDATSLSIEFVTSGVTGTINASGVFHVIETNVTPVRHVFKLDGSEDHPYEAVGSAAAQPQIDASAKATWNGKSLAVVVTSRRTAIAGATAGVATTNIVRYVLHVDQDGNLVVEKTTNVNVGGAVGPISLTIVTSVYKKTA